MHCDELPRTSNITKLETEEGKKEKIPASAEKNVADVVEEAGDVGGEREAMKGVLGGGGVKRARGYCWLCCKWMMRSDRWYLCVCVCVCVCVRARAQYTYVGIRIHTVRSGGDQGSGHWKQ